MEGSWIGIHGSGVAFMRILILGLECEAYDLLAGSKNSYVSSCRAGE